MRRTLTGNGNLRRRTMQGNRPVLRPNFTWYIIDYLVQFQMIFAGRTQGTFQAWLGQGLDQLPFMYSNPYFILRYAAFHVLCLRPLLLRIASKNRALSFQRCSDECKVVDFVSSGQAAARLASSAFLNTGCLKLVHTYTQFARFHDFR